MEVSILILQLLALCSCNLRHASSVEILNESEKTATPSGSYRAIRLGLLPREVDRWVVWLSRLLLLRLSSLFRCRTVELWETGLVDCVRNRGNVLRCCNSPILLIFMW